MSTKYGQNSGKNNVFSGKSSEISGKKWLNFKQLQQFYK